MEGIGQKKETDYIFDKTIKCDVCGKEFKTKQVRTGKARFIGTDEVLKPLYEGIDTCKYDIILCPHCGYAAAQRNYGHLTPKQRKAIRDIFVLSLPGFTGEKLKRLRLMGVLSLILTNTINTSTNI